MKKIFNILMLGAIAAVAFTSCNDDDVYVEDPTANQLTILSRETSFSAAPSQGTIVVDTNEPLSVSSNDQTGWISTSVEGNKVIVNVSLNESLDGRTAMLTIKGGEKQTQVAVMQSGVIVALDGSSNVSFNDAARTLTYNLKSNLPVEIYTNEDWIKPVYENGVLTIDLEANTTGHVRNGYVTYVAGPVSEEISITQADFSYLEGDYMLVYIDPDDGGMYYFDSTLKKEGTKYIVEIVDARGRVRPIPATFTPATADLRIAAGQYVCDYTTSFKLYTVVWDTNSGYLTWASTASMSADWLYEEEDGVAYTTGSFGDNGSWAGYAPTALLLEIFSGTPSSSTRLGMAAISMVFPTLFRAEELDAPTTASSASVSVAKSYAANLKARRIAELRNAKKATFFDDDPKTVNGEPIGK